MVLEQICAPALLYIAFSITQIIIDIFKRLYNAAFIKFIVMIIFSIVLNLLCKGGLGLISWFIVFVPFIMMTVISTLLLFVFGLSPSSGSLDYKVDYPSNVEPSTDSTASTTTTPEPESQQTPPPKKGQDTSPQTYNPNDINSGTPDDINNYNS